MLQIIETEKRFLDLLIEKETALFARLDYVGPAMASIAMRWIKELEPAALSILIYLIGRTVSFGKAAAQISISEYLRDDFEEGDDVRFAGLNLSLPTFRKHLSWLVENDFIEAYGTFKPGVRYEARARIYEINFKKLIGETDLLRLNKHILLDISRKITSEIEKKKGSPPPKNLEGSSCIYSNRNVVPLWKGSVAPEENSSCSVPPGSAAAGERSGIQDPEEEMLPTPKKERARPAAAPTPQTIEAAVAAVTKKHTEVAAARVSRVEQEFSEENLQALLDTLRKNYCPEAPRLIVTAKPFGVLRKRLKAADIDIRDFLTFTVRSWSQLAGQNKAARIRNPDKAKQWEGLSAAPSFAELAYKLPYFLKVYANHQTGYGNREASLSDAANKERIKNLETALRQSREENQEKDNIIRRMRRNVPQASTPSASHASPPPLRQSQSTVDIDDGWLPPRWEDREAVKPTTTATTPVVIRRRANGK